ncbi:MAG: patatin-like phospholipase family protein [Planctomycetales bacterium]|nr:patatin-like phospholipase family protein [Planctomycetales bacterium]
MVASTNPCQGLKAVVALGGGGARGMAHLGALEAIIDAGFAIERMVGCSIGGLTAAIYSTGEDLPTLQTRVVTYLTSSDFASKQESLFGADPKQVRSDSSGLLAWYDRIRSYLWTRHLLSRVVRQSSLLGCGVLQQVVDTLVPDIDIADALIPLSIVAVDLLSGHPVVLERGSLRKAVLASAAIPGIFPPVEWDNYLLSDLGVVDSLPSAIAETYTHDVLIGVDVGPTLETTNGCKSALHVLLRMDEIAEQLYRRHSKRNVDLLIRPDVGNYPWFDFSEPGLLINRGFEAGRDSINRWLHMPTSWQTPLQEPSKLCDQAFGI